MNKIQTREAAENELDQIYMMGFDVWAEGLSEDYLRECRKSPKYKRGTWFVLLEDDQLVSSLIVYSLGENQFGIGSIATPENFRNKGYASRIIKDVIQKIENKSPKAILFLYSDINPEFYEKFNFCKLPISTQRYETTICMIRGRNIEKYLSDKRFIPEYF